LLLRERGERLLRRRRPLDQLARLLDRLRCLVAAHLTSFGKWPVVGGQRLFDAVLVAGLQRAFAVFLRAGGDLLLVRAAELFAAEAVGVEHLFELAVRARDDVDADQFADAAGGGGPRGGRGRGPPRRAAPRGGGVGAAG